MNDNVLIEAKDAFFSNPIKIVHVSPNELTKRMINQSDPSLLPYPFVFSSIRKSCFEKLLPFPKKEITVIEGFSQAGKSNFACHLSLIYRMKPHNHAVIYIGNIGMFNDTPFNYIIEVIFYWFFEEIKESPMIQAMLKHAIWCHIDVIFVKKS